jgi:hypothetical protein
MGGIIKLDQVPFYIYIYLLEYNNPVKRQKMYNKSLRYQKRLDKQLMDVLKKEY